MTKLPTILTAITITALTLSGCIYGDKASDWVIAATNGCNHDVSTYLTITGPDPDNFNIPALREDGKIFTTLTPAERYGFWGMEGDPAAATLIVISDTDARFIRIGEDAGSTNDYTITGDDCLPALTTTVSEDDSDNAL